MIVNSDLGKIMLPRTQLLHLQKESQRLLIQRKLLWGYFWI